MQNKSSKKEKTSDELEARKSTPSDQEFPPKTGIRKQAKPIKTSKKEKSHKAIQ